MTFKGLVPIGPRAVREGYNIWYQTVQKHAEIYAHYKSLIWVQKMFEKKLQGKTYRKSVKSEKL
jgi:hypothetical protein